MAKSTLNLETPSPARMAQTETPVPAPPRVSRQFLTVGSLPNRLITANSIVAVIGADSAHCNLVLRSGEQLGTRHEAQEIVKCLAEVLGESLVPCGGRPGFYGHTHFIRLSAIESFGAVDATSVKVWYGLLAPLVLPISFAELEAHLTAAFDFTVTKPERIRSPQPTVPAEEMYEGSMNDRVLDQVYGTAYEMMGLPVPGRR